MVGSVVGMYMLPHLILKTTLCTSSYCSIFEMRKQAWTG